MPCTRNGPSYHVHRISGPLTKGQAHVPLNHASELVFSRSIATVIGANLDATTSSPAVTTSSGDHFTTEQSARPDASTSTQTFLPSVNDGTTSIMPTTAPGYATWTAALAQLASVDPPDVAAMLATAAANHVATQTAVADILDALG